MNKVMKFCGSCDEAFADRFSFCPNCGGGLETFEMNPVSPKAAAPQAPPAEAPSTPAVLTTSPNVPDVLEIPGAAKTQPLNPATTATREFSLPDEPAAVTAEIPAATRVEAPKTAKAAPAFTVPAMSADGGGNGKDGWREVKSVAPGDDDYHITMVEHRTFLNDPRLRAGGIFSIVLVLGVLFGAFVYDLFKQTVEVSAPGTEDLVYAMFPIDPDATIEEIMEQVKAKEDHAAGGGGGGGGNDADPPKKGDPPAFSKTDPQFKPTTHDRSVTNPELLINPAVQGPIDKAAPSRNVGVPKGGDKISDGTGGGGIGNNGYGGVGDRGRGGYGADGENGIGYVPGSGIGNREGEGRDTSGEPPSMKPAGPSKPVRITFQQKPAYTEEARKAQINGTVRLRVVFNANGTIGSVTPVGGLGYGLTEKAIIAAKNMRFEPALKNGQPVSTSKVVEFNFNIY